MTFRFCKHSYALSPLKMLIFWEMYAKIRKVGFYVIFILLASYNGEKYISEQLDSILSQTVKSFVIYINDDCSTDSTPDIINDYVLKYPEKIMYSRNLSNSGDAKVNFFNMMLKYTSDYIMLCDQDDIWLPDKIEVTLRRMEEIELKQGKHVPILVHTDLVVVNENLQILNESFEKIMNLSYHKSTFNSQLVQNVLTGNTVMYNKAFSELLRDVPANFISHDWWIMLVAKAFAEIGFVNKGTILYRQHSKNTIGVKNTRSLAYKFKRLLSFTEVKKELADTYKQAKCFLLIYSDILSEEKNKTLQEYGQFPNANKLQRLRAVFKYKIFKYGFFRMLLYLMIV